MTKDELERYNELVRNCAGHYDVVLPLEVQAFISQELRNAEISGGRRVCEAVNKKQTSIVPALSQTYEDGQKTGHDFAVVAARAEYEKICKEV